MIIKCTLTIKEGDSIITKSVKVDSSIVDKQYCFEFIGELMKTISNTSINDLPCKK